MLDTIQNAVTEAGKNLFITLPKLTSEEVVNIWDTVSEFVEKQLSMNKGVQIPGLGTFSFLREKLQVGSNRSIFLQRPVFLLSEKLAQIHGLKFNKIRIPGDIPIVQLNFIVLSLDGPFNRDTVEGCVRETLLSFSRSIATKQTVEFTFKGIGVLIIRDNKVKMKFYKDFLHTMDGSGTLLKALTNRPGTVDSVLSTRDTSTPPFCPSNTAVFPRLEVKEMETIAEEGQKSSRGSTPGRPKSKNLQPKIQEYEFSDDPIDVPRIPKNDAPNRFWASVEPYCADLTNEEVRTLDDLLKPPEDEAEHYKIPPLGKHYSQRWAQEDLLEEQKDGARAAATADKKKGILGPLTELDTKDVDALLKKSESQHEQPEDGCPFGPLTQRLLQALVEENIISPIEDSPIPEIAGKDSAIDGASTSPRSQNKPFSVPHTKSLEGRIKEELIAQGLLESEDRPAEDSEDEVLAELRKRQAELKALSTHNRTKKVELLRLAKEELHRQELRQRVRIADNEVMDAFRKIMAARQKKRTPTKKEKDQAWKSLKERESILKLLDG